MQRLQQRILTLLSHLPLAVLHALASLIFVVAYYVVRWRRTLVHSNLKRAFPDSSSQEIEHIARKHFRALLDTALETLKSGTLSTAELHRRVTIENIEVLEELGDQPYLLISGHQGNWEWQNLALADKLSVPMEAIYAQVPSPAMDAFLLAARARFGTTLIEQQQTLVAIAKRLKQPRAIIMLADQNPRRDAERYWTVFLQQDTAFGVGMEKIARLSRYPVIFQEGFRTGRGHYAIRFQRLAAPPYDKEGHAILEAYARALETAICAHPADWLWSYERWRYPKPLYG